MVIFDSMAHLLAPAGDRTVSIVEAGPSWRVQAPAAPAVVWGRPPLPSGTPLGAALRSAAGRERALTGLRLRPPRGMEVTEVHRWAAREHRRAPAWNTARSALLGGALVVMSDSGRYERVIDAVAGAAGASPPDEFRPGTGGSGLAIVAVEKTSAILRAGRAGGPGDPRRAAFGLEALKTTDDPVVPRSIRHGATAGAGWSLETLLPGRRPRRMTPALVREVVSFCARLPHSDLPAVATDDDAGALARSFPQWKPAFENAARIVAETAESMPSVLRHGDLWSGNILAQSDRLTGVIDWDAWHPATLPGTDLLHLVALEEQMLERSSLGGVFVAAPWNDEPFLSVAQRYWAALKVRPDADARRAIGIAWWAGHVAATVARLPHVVDRPAWVERNVAHVAEALIG